MAGISTKTKVKYNRNESIVSWVMILPQVIGFLIFTIYPMIWVYRFAFYDYDGVSGKFVGLENFVRLFTRDPKYWSSLLNTFIIAYGKLIIEYPLALLLAIAVNKKTKTSTFFRIGFYMPTVVSTAIVGLVFSYIFSSYNGPVNNILETFGLINEPINWFGAKWTAMAVLMLASIWQSFGTNMLYLLAGLQGIPEELYEAAAIDGANTRQKFFNITLPQLLPMLKILLMLSMIYGMQIMDLVMVTTNGAPAGETDVVMLYIYRFFFDTNNSVKQWGYASSLGVVTSFIIAAATLFYLKMSSKKSSD